MYGSFEVFVDTIIVCTMTSLAIMCSGSDIWASGVKAEALTMSAFDATYGTTDQRQYRQQSRPDPACCQAQ